MSLEPAGHPPRESPRETLGELVRRAPVSAAIIAVNVVVFVLAELAGDTKTNATLIRFGAVWRELVWRGEVWRLGTAMFLHIGVIHLVWNGLYGFRMSPQAEQAIGRGRFIGLYLLGGIVASATSVIGHDAVSAGASGALFALIGWRLVALRMAMGSFRAFARHPDIRRELIWVGAWFVVGVVVGFDNYAHGGGLVFGALYGWMLAAPAGKRGARIAVTLAVAAAIVLLSLRPLPLLHQGDSVATLARGARAPAG